MQQTEPITYNRARTWQIAFFALNNTATNTALFLMGYYAYFSQNILGLAAVIVGAIATIMRVFDGITDPLIGFILDKTNTRFGRFRPFMLGGSLIMCCCITAIFHTPSGLGTTTAYIYTTILYAIYIIGYTCQTTVTKAAQAVLTNDPKQRPLYSGFDAVYTRLSGAVISVLITSILATKYGTGEYEGSGMLNPQMWKTASLILCAMILIMTLLAMIGVAEKDHPSYYIKNKTIKIAFKDYVDVVAHNRPVQMLIIAAATDKLGSLLQNGLLVYIFGNLLLHSRYQGVYSVLCLIPVMISAFVGVAIARKVGLKRNFLAGTIGSMCMLIILFLYRPDPQNPWIWIILYIIQNCIVVFANGSVIPMLADCTDYETYRSGRFIPGMIGTIFSFIDKLLSSLSTLIVGLALVAAGMGNSVIPPNQDLGSHFNTIILLCFCGIPILGHIASIIAMKFYPLNSEKMAEIQAELHRRSQEEKEN